MFSVRGFDVKDFGDNGLRQGRSFWWRASETNGLLKGDHLTDGPLRSLFFLAPSESATLANAQPTPDSYFSTRQP
jgi:hypothetical protein